MNFNSVQFFVTIFLIVYLKICTVEGIVGGHDAIGGQFKYQVELLASDDPICGGAIISKRHILTAAHCVINEKNQFINSKYSVIAGITHIKDKSTNRIVVPVQKIFVPKNYKLIEDFPSLYLHRDITDVAVLELEHELKIEENPSSLAIVELPSSLDFNSYENEEAVISAFGSDTVINDNSYENKGIRIRNTHQKKKFAEVKIVLNDRCGTMYHANLHENKLCAQVKQTNRQVPEGVCTGDSGSPLVQNGKTVIGILSLATRRCGEQAQAAIYTRITSCIGFIRKAMADEKSDDIRVAAYVTKKTFFWKKKYLVEIENRKI